MTATARNHEILGAIRINQTLGELDEAAQELTGPLAAAVNRAYDLLDFELWGHTVDLVKKNLGPRQQKRLMLVLKTVGEVIDAEKAERHTGAPTLRPGTPDQPPWL